MAKKKASIAPDPDLELEKAAVQPEQPSIEVELTSPGEALAQFNETMEREDGQPPYLHPTVHHADEISALIDKASNNDCTPAFVAALKAANALYKEARGLPL